MNLIYFPYSLVSVEQYCLLYCAMESLRKKRKGSETPIASSDIQEILPPPPPPPPHCIIVICPHCGNSYLDPHGRGHKRKIRCIDAATQLGRKKKIDHEYVPGFIIGKGNFGLVCLCQNKTTRVEFACKTVPKGKENVHREVEIMQHLSNHPGVVTLKEAFEDSNCFHLVMELCSGGHLLDQMDREGRYSEHKAANILKQIISTIQYCHEMGVVHRDIKPQNILLTKSGKMKLADFGLAVRISNGQILSGKAGSPAYIAPEVLQWDYSNEVDIWSAGVLLYTLLVGTLPFNGGSLGEVFEAIKKSKLDFHTGVWESISGPARDLTSRMLTRDVSARITANEILTHPWILFHSEESERCRIDDDSGLVLSSNGLGRKTKEEDDSSFVDALVVAISHVRISKPKRSRLCGTTSPIQQKCLSNMKAIDLCTAF